MDVQPDARRPFDVKYYLIAMAFLVFDVEVVFLFPWAVRFKQLGLFGLIEMFVFIFILLVGYAYIWKKGVLEWE
jgi:NADH-quinone oxidoreductase subunit A